MKIQFNLDDVLPLNKTIKIHSMIIVSRAVFYENKTFYLQVFLDEYLYKLWVIWKCCIMIELALLKELSLIRQVNQNTEKFFTIGVF